MLRKVMLLLATASILLISLPTFAVTQSNFVFAKKKSEREYYLNLAVYNDDRGENRVVFRLCKLESKNALMANTLPVNDKVCSYVGKKEGYLTTDLDAYVKYAKKARTKKIIIAVGAGIGVAFLTVITGGVAGLGLGSLGGFLGAGMAGASVGIVVGAFTGIFTGIKAGKMIAAPVYNQIKVLNAPNNGEKVMVKSLKKFVNKSLKGILEGIDAYDYAF